MNMLVLIFCITFMLFTTGCQNASDSIVVKENLPGHAVQGIYVSSSSSLNRTKSGVIIYRDHSVYNTTKNPNAFKHDLIKNKDVNFGPGNVKFGPNDIK